MIKIEEYYDEFIQQIYTSADVNEDFRESQFFEKAMEYIVEDGSVEDFRYLPYKKTGMKIDGYDFVLVRQKL